MFNLGTGTVDAFQNRTEAQSSGNDECARIAPMLERQWSPVQLAILRQKVHKQEICEDGDREFIVSNLRKFSMDVALLQTCSDQELAFSSSELRVQAVLTWEDGEDVDAVPGSDMELKGDTEFTLKSEQKTVFLQFGKDVLSSKCDRRKFKVRLEPVDKYLRHNFQSLSVATRPLRSVTKLDRRAPEPIQENSPVLRTSGMPTECDTSDSLGFEIGIDNASPSIPSPPFVTRDKSSFSFYRDPSLVEAALDMLREDSLCSLEEDSSSMGSSFSQLTQNDGTESGHEGSEERNKRKIASLSADNDRLNQELSELRVKLMHYEGAVMKSQDPHFILQQGIG